MRGNKAISNLAMICIEKLNKPRCKLKGAWENVDVHDLLKLLREEVEELQEALSIWDTPDCCDKEHMDLVVEECADVANYAAMIAENVKNEMKVRF